MEASGQTDSQKTVRWGRIWSLAIFLGLLGTALNEGILRSAGHYPSLVSDDALWAMEYARFLETATEDSVVLLGASRMQGNIDLEVMKNILGCDSVYQLAQNGRGSGRTIFERIVKETDFSGTIILSEKENTLVAETDRQLETYHAFKRRPLDASLNRRVSSFLQSRFVFLNPNSSSLRLWGNLLLERTLPEPFHVITHSDRSQSLHFERADIERINALRAEGIADRSDEARTKDSDAVAWLNTAKGLWQETTDRFVKRGGRAIFVRLPIAQHLWDRQSRIWPLAQFWKSFFEAIDAQELHFAEYPDLQSFELPDTSHIGFQDKEEFTERFARAVQKMEEPSR